MEIMLLLSLLLKVAVFYFAAVALFALKKRKEYPAVPPKTRFAVIIAARNEEDVICRPVRSVLAQNYPPHLRDVYVVPNHCTDRTGQRAAEAGAKIIACPDSVRCKGDALHIAFGVLPTQEYDAFVVLDADNTLAEDYLSRLNDAVAAGACVFKTRTRTANPCSSAVSGCYGLYNTLFDLFWNRPRCCCGLSAKIIGTGFGFTRDYLEELGGWNTATIAEDAEFAAQCARRGRRVWWVPEAVNYDEAPTDPIVSLRQRRRWCSGVVQVGRQELPRLVMGGGGMLRFDMVMFFLEAFFRPLSGLVLAAALLSGLTAAPLASVCCMALYCGGGVLAGAVLSVAGGYGLRHMVGAVLAFPLFMASWLPLQVLALLRDTTHWSPIRHSGANCLPGG